jgi:hypothetical protein
MTMDPRKKGMCQVILRLGRKRFGEPNSAVLRVLHALFDAQDQEQLDKLCDRLIEATSWQDFLNENE